MEEIAKLRELLFDASVLAGRLTEAVSARKIPAEYASLVNMVRHNILGLQSAIAVLQSQLAIINAPAPAPPDGVEGRYSL